MARQKLQGLQLLRGIASFQVVLFHMTGTFRTENEQVFLGGWFRNSSSAVLVFFVLSGFIIFYASRKLINSRNISTFYIKRFIRIFPIYWFSISYLAVFYLLTDPGKFPATIQGYLKMITLWFGHLSLNGVSWSLSYEIYFYLLFGLLILSKHTKYILYALLIMCVLSATSLLNIDMYLGSYLFNGRNVLFAMGVVLAIYYKKFNLVNNPKVSFLLFTAFFVGYLYWDYNQSFKDFHYQIIVGLFACAFILLLIKSEDVMEHKIWTPFIYLGNISYSLYLVHLPVVNFSLKKFFTYNFSHSTNIIFAVFLMCLVIVISHFTYKYIERPSVKLLKYFDKK